MEKKAWKEKRMNKAEWIAVHGSGYLKGCRDAGYDANQLYTMERLESFAVGWRRGDDTLLSDERVDTPSEYHLHIVQRLAAEGVPAYVGYASWDDGENEFPAVIVRNAFHTGQDVYLP